MEAFKIYGIIEVLDAEAIKKLDNISQKAQNVSKKFGTATENIQKRVANLGKGFKTVGKSFSGIGKTFENVGKTLSVAITAPVVALGTATAKTAIEFLSLKEQTRTAFQVLLGSAEEAEKMLKELHVFAKTTPFSYQTYLQAGKTLVAMGVSAEDCIPYLEGITNAAIATGTGQQGIDRISQALGRMQSSGKVTLEMLNILTHSGIPAVKILANQYGVTTEEMFKMISESKILADEALPKLIKGMNEGTNGAAGMTAAYGGLAKEMKGTLTGALDKLRSRFRDMSVDIWNAEEAYPHLTKAIEEFTGSLDVLPKIFESISRAAVPALEKVTSGLRNLKRYLDSLSPEQLKKIGDTILKLAVAGPALVLVGKAFKTIGGTLSSIGEALKVFSGAIPTILPALSNMATACGGVGAFLGVIAAAIVGVISVAKVLADNWDKVTKVFNNFTKNIQLSEKFRSIRESADKLWEKLKSLGDVFTVIGTVILTALQPTFAGLAGMFNGAVSAISPLLDAIGGLVDVLAGLGEFIVGVFTLDWEKAWNGIKKTAQGAIDFIKGLWDSLTSFLKGGYEGTIGYIKALFDGLDIGELLSKLWNSMSKWFGETKEKIKDKLVEWGKAIVKWFEDLPEKTKEKLDEWRKAIVNWFKDKKDTIVSGVKDWWQNTVDWFNQTPFAQAFETIKTEAGKVMEDRDYLITLIDGWTEGLNQWSSDKLKEITEEFNGWKDSISNWFTEKKNTIVDGFNEWWSNTTTWFSEQTEEIKTKFGEWGTAISTWFTEKKDTIVNGFTEWWNNTTTWFSELPTKVTEKFDEWKTAITTWFTEKSNTITNGFTEWWNNTTTWFSNLPTTVTTEFENMKTSVSTWFTDKKNTLVDGFNAWIESVKTWFTGEDSGAKQLGEDVVSEIASGVEETTNNGDFILRLGQSILKLLGAAVVAVGVALLGVGWAIVDWIFKGISQAWEGLKTSVTTKVKQLGDNIGKEWENVKTTTSNTWNTIKTNVGTTVENIKTTVSNKWNDMKTSVGNTVENIKSTVSSKWGNIKTSVGNTVSNIKTNVVNKFQEIDSQTGGKLSSFASKVSTKFGEIKTNISKKMEDAKTAVSNVLEKIKGLFNFSWSLPKLKMPHFKASGSFSLNPPSVPSISVEWYKKAMDNGMILNDPTIFGMAENGTLLGGGEAGSETVVGTESLMDMIQNATDTNNKYIAELLEKILMYLQSSMPELASKQLVLDTGVLAGELAPSINTRLGLISEGQSRGRS